MPTNQTSPLAQPLPHGLILRTARNEEDIERIALFNGVIHGAELIPAVRGLAAHYPDMEYADWVFVEDETSGEMISSLCLIPWTLRYGRVDLRVGEMGLVGTIEAYRRRGLVRVQIEYFQKRLAERGCLLSFIQGIPYYYRQFGYEYALPLEGGLRLSGRELPDLAIPDFTFRRATVDDLPILQRLYDEAAADLTIGVVRSQDHWRYILTHPQLTTLVPEFLLILDREGRIAGYFMLPENHFYDELSINESSRLSFDAGLAVLRHCRDLAAQRKLPGVRLNLPANNTLAQMARSFGAHDLGLYAWQIHVADMAALLRAIAPVLEDRLAASPFAGLTGDLLFCFFRESVRLSFVGGKVDGVAAEGPAQGSINFPPLKIIPLIFGHRTVEELRAASPDIHVDNARKLLIDTLFPQVTGFIYVGY
ncbi:MAG: GNAT family N-acetyltransferase [Caldilineaceae bacterium]|nr:GNAT family N-acetyltransferase [Caldilineaceae bacterium]